MATKKKSARSSKFDLVLDDARHVMSVARKHQKVFATADKGKKKVRVDAALLTTIDANVRAVATATSALATSKARKEQATAVEEHARVPLAEILIDIRDDIATIHQDNKAVQRAFGVGTRIDKSSTPILLKLASDVLHNVESDRALGKAAQEAGVDKSRLTQLKKAHQALAAAQAGQVSAIAGARLDSVDKRALARTIAKDVSFVRKVAAIVFRKHPKELKEFASTLPKRKVKPRPKKTPPPKTSVPSP